MRVAVAFDHRGVKLRERVLEELASLGHEALDLGTDTDAVRIDYPDKAKEVGEAVLGGRAERGVRVCVTGVTSNPTIFQKAISQGNAYDDQMRDLLEHDDDPTEIFIALAGRDIGEACDLMRRVWDNGKGLRGYISMEVDPNYANDTEAT